MTRKIKNTLLITLVGLLFAIVGLTLFSSAASIHKTNADSTVETLIFSLDFDDEQDLHYVEGHLNCNTLDKVSIEDSKLQMTVMTGAVRHFFVNIPFNLLEQNDTFKFSFDFNAVYNNNMYYKLFIRTFHVKYLQNGNYKFLNVDTLSSQSTRYLRNYNTSSENHYEFYLSKDELDLSSCPCTPSYLCFGLALTCQDDHSVMYSEFGGFEMYGVGLPNQTVNVMHDNQVIKSYTVEQGSIITADTLRKDLDCANGDGYSLVGLSFTADGEAAQLTDLTVTSDMTLYAVYDKIDNLIDVEESNFGDKISDFANNVSSWLKDNTGVAISSGSLIIVAIVVVLFMLTKRK